MFFKVLLFAVYTAFLHLEGVTVFEFGLGFLELNLLDDLVIVTLDLTHYLHFAHLHLLCQGKALFDELLSLASHDFQVADNFIAILLENIN